MIVESLQLLLGFEFDKKELKKFDESVKTINKSLVALGATVLASTTAITAMTLSSSRSAVDMLKLSSATGTAVENLEALEFVSAQNSIQSSTLSGALESVRNNIAGISKGSGSALEAFSMLGIEAYGADGKLRDSYETMKEATEKLSKMTDATRQAEYAQQIFGGSASEMMFMIRKGSRAFSEGEDAMKRYGSALSREELENVSKFSQTWDTLKNSFSQFTDLVWSRLAPAMNDLVEGFLEWWAINRKIITENAIKYYKAFAKTIITIVKFFWEFVKVVTIAVEKLGGFEKVLRMVFWAITAIMALKFLLFLGTVATMAVTVGSAIMAMNLRILLIPILIASAIALAGLIIEDFFVFMSGGKSVLGAILGEWSDTVRNGFRAWQDFVWKALTQISDAFHFWGENGLDGFKKAFEVMMIWLKVWYQQIVTFMTNKSKALFDAITKPFKDAMAWVEQNPLIQGFMDGVDRTFKFFNSGEQNAGAGIGADNRVTSPVFNNTYNPNFNVQTNNPAVASGIIGSNQREWNFTLDQYTAKRGF